MIADPVTVADLRHAWIAAARALGEHKRVCVACQGRQDCGEYAVLDGRERDAWEAYELAGSTAP